jgi:perosamine synthetase
MTPIPVNTPLLGEEEKRLLVECVDSGWISSEGPFVEEFEAKFAARMGRRYGVSVTNGSAALDAAVAALRLGPGDEVILPSHTIISCAQAITRAGADPVPVDCDPETWNMTVEGIAAAITPRTRAIMVVHIFGLPVDMGGVIALAEKHGLQIIEDAAQAQGQDWNGRPCGSFGTISTFSLYANKLVATGEGGMILTDDPDLAARCRSLRNLCFNPARRFVHDELGWNLRFTNLQAAVGLAQLARLDDSVARKRAMGRYYHAALGDLPGLQLPLPTTVHAENVYWVYGLVLDDDFPFDAAAAMQRFASRQIGTRPFFWPIHEQPVFRREGRFAGLALPVSERIARRGFYLPSGLGLTRDQMERVAEAAHAILAC